MFSVQKTNPDALIQLVYASAATVDFTPEDLETLLQKARKNNTELDVTGMLLFKDGTFFQILEGISSVVHGLYDKIESDVRHSNVLILCEEEITERNFGEWRMGFVADHNTFRDIPGYSDFFANGEATFLDLKGETRRMQQILEGFRRGRWRRQPV